ncbi:hypothetical protein [Streptomyces sp. AP-93]|uniref:hypothetical protein n=1 Tax=Streptomyces sp. AP-93 TaxID=2929048 RepID=UPI001FAF22E5|nr:hypothetical protein [Streptomyces sp. AP-93]MCJ0873711.1 hypothetical protein [Streptomyces sp. AP-93]
MLHRSTSPDTTAKVSGFYRSGDGPVRASAMAYQGAWNTKGDQFRVNSANITAAAAGNSRGPQGRLPGLPGREPGHHRL